jgi:hypothetical protein
MCIQVSYGQEAYRMERRLLLGADDLALLNDVEDIADVALLHGKILDAACALRSDCGACWITGAAP